MTGKTGHIPFNANTAQFVDRIMILCIDTDEMQIEVLADGSASEILRLAPPCSDGKLAIALSKLRREPPRDIPAANSAVYKGYTIRELESGTIEVELSGQPQSPVLPILRELALELSVPTVNANGNALNTRSLASHVIGAVKLLP